jgi:cysteine synthase A
MSRIFTSADQLIGNTPLLELTHIEKAEGLQAKLFAKLEYFNPRFRQGPDRQPDRRRRGRGKLTPDSVNIEPPAATPASVLPPWQLRAATAS